MKRLTTLTLAAAVLLALGNTVLATDIIVDPNGSADFTTIQAAITASANGDTIIVSPGTYVENINMGGKAITLRSTDPLDATIVTSTIIDGGASGSVITCGGGETSATVIEGFVITNGSTVYGGGMSNTGSSPTIRNCTISGNAATDGGGMMNYVASPTVSNCTFSDNTASDGGGMKNYKSSATIDNCIFNGNTANLGGGIYDRASFSVTINNCTFSGNAATDKGGGMYNFSSSPTLSNCTFSKNTANNSGGIMYNNISPAPTVTDSHFCLNTPNTIDGEPLHPDSGGNNFQFCPPPRPIAPEIEGDLNNDDMVNLQDLAILAANWLTGTE
ncbi:MAG: hypothetical protein FVQ82_14200 [Planctomycetes bacterium]|nr:hypothetical protein [Planctomycetota bacterium]